jgi:hypothetical protein
VGNRSPPVPTEVVAIRNRHGNLHSKKQLSPKAVLSSAPPLVQKKPREASKIPRSIN